MAQPALAMPWRVETEDENQRFRAIVSMGDPSFQLFCSGGEASDSLNYVFVLEISPDLFDEPLPEVRSDVVVGVDNDGFLLPHLARKTADGAYQQRLSMADPLFVALRQGKRLRLMLPDGREMNRPLRGMSTTLSAAMAFCRNRLLARGIEPPPDLIPLYQSSRPLGPAD